MVGTLDRVRAFIDQQVVAVGAFASDVPALTGTAAAPGFLAGRSVLPSRVVLALTERSVHALEPGMCWRPRRLIAAWPRADIGVRLDGRVVELSIPGHWPLRFVPLGEPARHLIDVLRG